MCLTAGNRLGESGNYRGNVLYFFAGQLVFRVAIDEHEAQGYAEQAKGNRYSRCAVQTGWISVKAHLEYFIESADPVGLAGIVHKILSQAAFELLFVEGRSLIDLEHVQIKVLAPAQEKGGIGARIFLIEKFDGRVQQVVQIGHADDRLIETRRKADGVEFPDEYPLGSNQIVAKYVYLFRLLLAFFVELFQQQKQSFMSLVITHGHPVSIVNLSEFTLLSGYFVRLINREALEANGILSVSSPVAP